MLLEQSAEILYIDKSDHLRHFYDWYPLLQKFSGLVKPKYPYELLGSLAGK